MFNEDIWIKYNRKIKKILGSFYFDFDSHETTIDEDEFIMFFRADDGGGYGWIDLLKGTMYLFQTINETTSKEYSFKKGRLER